MWNQIGIKLTASYRLIYVDGIYDACSMEINYRTYCWSMARLKLLRWRLWNDRRKRKRTNLQVDGLTKNIWRKRRNGPRNFDFSSFMHTTLRCAIVISMCYMIPVTKALWQLSEMIENSREWALRRGLVERNPVHGTEDCSIRISRSFEHSVSKSHETNQKVKFTTQDHSSSVFGIVWLLDPAHAALLTCYINIYIYIYIMVLCTLNSQITRTRMGQSVNRTRIWARTQLRTPMRMQPNARKHRHYLFFKQTRIHLAPYNLKIYYMYMRVSRHTRVQIIFPCPRPFACLHDGVAKKISKAEEQQETDYHGWL